MLMQKVNHRRAAMQTHSLLLTSKLRRDRQQEFKKMIKETREVDFHKRPLGSLEINTLNDKLELSDEDDQENDKKKIIESIDLPFGADDETISRRRVNKLEAFRTKRKLLTAQVKSKLKNLMREQSNAGAKINKKNNQIGFEWKDTVFHADGYWKIIWDTFCMFLIFYEIITIPFKLSFDVTIHPDIDQAIDIIFIVDIAFTFNTSIYKKGVQVFDRKQIIINYLQFWFWIDLASSFPYDTIIEGTIERELDENNEYIQTHTSQQSAAKYTQTLALLRMLKFIRFIKIMRLLRLAKLKVFFDRIDEFLQLYVVVSTIFSFLKLCCFVLFWSHWLACIFHYIAVNEDPEDNWLYHYGIQDENWDVKYVIALYWGVTTMITVGYGDVSPQTTIEKLFGVFFLMIATVVFSVTLSSIGSFLQTIEEKKSEIREKINQTITYMKEVQVPSDLQARIKKYLNYVWEQEAMLSLLHLADHLSYALRTEFQVQVHGANLGLCPALRLNFSRNFLKEVTKTFNQYTALPDELLIQEHQKEYSQNHIYFIVTGNVRILLQKTNQVIGLLEKNDYFGEIAFFSDQAHRSSIQSVSFSSFIYIDREKFLSILRQSHNQAELQHYFYIRDEINHHQNYSVIHVRCFGCQRDDHTVVDCPNLHYILDKTLYFMIKQKFQQRVCQIYERKEKLYFNTRANLELIQQQAQAATQIQPLARRYLQAVEEWNLNESQIDSDNDSRWNNKPSPTKPPRFGPFRSRFREDRKKFRKLKSYIIDQDQKIKALRMKQSINELVLKQLTNLMQSRMFSQQSEERSSQIVPRKSKKIGSVTSLMVDPSQRLRHIQDLDQDRSEGFQTVSSSSEGELEIAQTSGQLSTDPVNKPTLQEIDNQYQILEYLQKYAEEQMKKQEEEFRNNMERQFSILPDFDKGADFYYYYPIFNQEILIDEYNQILEGKQYRPSALPDFENEFYLEFRKSYSICILENNQLTSKLISLENTIHSSQKLSRQSKLERGIIRQPKSHFKKTTSIRRQQFTKSIDV